MPAARGTQLTLPGDLGRYRRLSAPTPLPHRFWAKVDISGGRDACWGWLGALSAKRHGHVRGVIWHQHGAAAPPRLLIAPRVALWLASDPCALSLAGYDRLDAPVPLHACHRCPGAAGPWALCCNPRHLAWGTAEENRRDRYGAAVAAIISATFGDEL